MKKKTLFTLAAFFLVSQINLFAQDLYYLPGFQKSPYFDEQILSFSYWPEVKVQINAPSALTFAPNKKVYLILYALPNGNTTDWTIGRKLNSGDDWHYDIQHIGAQTRFLREHIKDANIVTVYLETDMKSWPSWRRKYSDNAAYIKNLADSLRNLFKNYDTRVILNGHSGGGSFIFGFLNSVSRIPDYVDRIGFLDSDYAYDDSLGHGDKIASWLKESSKNCLCVIAYNDSIALYNGSPVVSPTGGTWYRSKMMKHSLEKSFLFTDKSTTDFLHYQALSGRVNFILKENPARAILHTTQVELNGFIESIVSGTSYEAVDYIYYGQRAYTKWIQEAPASFPKSPEVKNE